MFTCSNPKLIHLTPVNCGSCYNCQMRKRAEWDFRLLYESIQSVDSVFVTLTYDNDHLEPLNKRVLQLYFKKLRNLGYVFKYYAVGEFGEVSGRQHYHVLLFIQSYPPGVNGPLSLYGTWANGMMDIGSFTPKSVHYVTKWHVHPKYCRDHPRESHGFTLQSKSLGSLFLQSLTKDNFIPYVSFMGNSYPVSRYFRKKLEISVPDIYIKSCYESLREKYPNLSDFDIRNMMLRNYFYSLNKQKSLRYEKI